MNKSKLEMSSSEIARVLGTVGSPLVVISELLKNSIDASAVDIMIKYNKEQRNIQVIDNGIGFSLETIQSISKPGFSRKKLNGYLKNDNGLFLTGSKGLGLLSVFSLCREMSIDTYTSAAHIQAFMHRDSGEFEYETEDNRESPTGTVITLSNVSVETMEYLESEVEIRKLMHICTYLYKHDAIQYPMIRLQIDDAEPRSILMERGFGKPTYDVIFSFDKDHQTLSFLCKSPKDCSLDPLAIQTFDNKTLGKLLSDEFQINDAILTRTNDITPVSSVSGFNRVPSFEGRVLVYERYAAGSELKEYGAGVNVYVNEFALYNYLSEENDWLGLADFSQRKKATRAKPHNVFGYVNFPDFDENKEELSISNERADFIQNPIYAKLMYLLKGVVMFLLFNIDVADKNAPGSKSGSENPSPTIDDGNTDGNTEDQGDKKANTQDKAESNNSTTDYMEQEKPGIKHSGGAQDQGEPYLPESVYKPKTPDFKHLRFTKQDGLIIDKLKSTDDLGNKIYQLIVELNSLEVQKQMYATSFVFRSLLEGATRYAAQKYPGKITMDKDSLSKSIVLVLNHFGNLYSKDKEIMKKIDIWREATNKRKVIDILNQYIHADQAVDANFVEQAWKSMKPYIVFCLNQ